MPQPPQPSTPATPPDNALTLLQAALLVGLLSGVAYGQTGWPPLGWAFGLLCAAPLALLSALLVWAMAARLIAHPPR